MILKEIVEKAKEEGLTPDVEDCIDSIETNGIGRFQFYSVVFQDDYCMLKSSLNPCPLQEVRFTKELCVCQGSEYRDELNCVGGRKFSMWDYV